MFPRSQRVIRQFIASLLLGPLMLLGASASSSADEPNAATATISAEIRARFEKQIQPLLVKTCGNCHGQKPKDNDLDLTRFGSAESIVAKPKVLIDVAERLRLGDMPPKDAPQPTTTEREQLLG